jgi:hypothetical protein
VGGMDDHSLIPSDLLPVAAIWLIGGCLNIFAAEPICKFNRWLGYPEWGCNIRICRAVGFFFVASAAAVVLAAVVFG